LAGFLQSGVDLYFVLSGFLIKGILLDAKGSRHYFRNFYARRVLRIFPLYYLVLTAGLVILPAISHPMSQKWRDEGDLSQWWYWLFLSNWWIALRGYGPRNGLIDLSWTLSIEEQFYLIWPFVVGWFERKGLIRVCIGLIATAFAFRLSLAVAGAPDAWPHMMTPARLDALGVGSLIALLVRGRRGVAGILRPAAWVAAATLPLLAVLILPPGWVPGWHVLSIACGGTTMAAFFGALLVMTLGGRPGSVASRVFGNSALRAFGIYSYGLYLFHNPIQ
jgi:peptidoglycan/LPS O-acetylase OafA/YrhL